MIIMENLQKIPELSGLNKISGKEDIAFLQDFNEVHFLARVFSHFILTSLREPIKNVLAEFVR